MSKPHKPTVVCIAADLDPKKLGGAEVHLIETLKLLHHNYNFILFTGPNDHIKSILPKSIQVVTVDYPKIPNFYGLSYITFGYFQIIKHLNHTNFDLIWAKQSFPQAPIAVLIKKRYKKPLYVTVQNPLLHKQELVLKGPLIKPFQQLFANLLTPMIAYSLKQANTISAVSTYSANLCQSLGTSKPIVIPNGVNLRNFTYQQTKSSSPFTIITTSSLIPRNGIDILIKAAALLPFHDWKLIIAGDGPLENSLKKLTNQKNLDSKVTFLGRVPHQEISKLLKKTHLFVRPSRWEGFGVSFIESMASGIPVVTTPVGGIPDFVSHKKTGLLAQVDNPQSTAQQITLLKQDTKLYQTIKKNARQLVETKYTWETIASQINTQFKKLLKENEKVT